MLSIKQIGTICFAIFSFIFPSFGYVENNDPCTNDTLTVQSGSANLVANWQGNPISLNWYETSESVNPISGIAVASRSCTYGGGLTPPATIPTRTGYTFKGWRPRDLTCGLSHVDTSIEGTWFAGKGSTGYCAYYNIDTGNSVDGDCSDSHVAGLNNSEWKANFSYGTVKGMSKCSGLSGNNHDLAWGGNSADWSATESQLTSAGNGQYCWCAATSYTPDVGTQCNIASPSWVFLVDLGLASDCADYCAGYCGSGVVPFAFYGVRRALFGVSQ